MAAHTESNQAVGASDHRAGPVRAATIHALAARLGSSLSRRLFNLVVTNILLADRDAMPDVDLLARCIEESLRELVDAVQ